MVGPPPLVRKAPRTTVRMLDLRLLEGIDFDWISKKIQGFVALPAGGFGAINIPVPAFDGFVNATRVGGTGQRPSLQSCAALWQIVAL